MLQKIKSFFQSIWNKMVDWAKLIWNESWTRGLAWVSGLSSSILTLLSYLNDYLTDPMFKSYLDLLSVPKEVTIAIATLSVLVWFAHGRKNDVVTA